MHILHVQFSFITGGTETMLVDIINEQIKTNEVSLLVINDKFNKVLLDKIDSRAKIYYCGRPEGSKNPWYFLKANWLLHRIHPDIIHTHDDKLRILLRWRGKAKLVYTKHNVMDDSNGAKQFNLIDSCYGISKAACLKMEDYGVSAKLVYNGIHPEGIKKKEKDWVPGNILNIIEVGRLDVEKGQQVVIEAFRILKERNIKGIKMTFIGDGANRPMLEKMVKVYGLSSSFSFLGMRDRKYIYTHLSDYDLFIQPSLSEGFGLTIAEAMAARLPVITSDQAGSLEVLDGGRLGLSFKTGDAKDLANKIFDYYNGIISINADEGLSYVYANFDIKVTAQKYVEEYKKILC